MNNKRGNGYIYTGVMVIFLAMLLCIVLKYYEYTGVVNANKDYVSQKLDSYMTQYSIDHYTSFRTGSAYSGELDYRDLENKAGQALSVNAGKTFFVSDKNYAMENVVMSSIKGNQVGVRATYDLIIPVSFGSLNFPNLRVHLVVRSRLVDMW